MTDNPPIKIYKKKIKHRVTFIIKTGYSLKLLMPKTMNLVVKTKIKISKDENGKYVCHLEITELVLVHWNIFNNDYQ